MVILYVVSVEKAVGKTAICAGLAKNLINDNKKVGYLKPQAAAGATDGDIAFVRQITGSPEGDAGGADAYRDRDVVLLEGMLGDGTPDIYGSAREMNARIIAVEAYSERPADYTEQYRKFGDNLVGIVLNKVPVSQLKSAGDAASARFGAAGIKVLGVLPEDRTLFAVTVGELAGSINGKILNNEDKSAELVENIMLGAMVVDSGLGYFGRKDNKAAVIRQDRPDMQMAALETSTACLVLCGSSEPPTYHVREKAEKRSIPIIATEMDTNTIVTGIEGALGNARLSQVKKLPKLAGIVKERLDIAALI